MNEPIGSAHWNWKGGTTYQSQRCVVCNTEFKAKPHAKRRYCSNKCFVSTRTGKPSESKQWKGKNASYRTIHTWVTRWRGRPKHCEHCDTTDENKTYEWANKSHEYKRELEDWLRLCRSCHRYYDKSADKTWATRRANNND